MEKLAIFNEDTKKRDLILREKALSGDKNALGELIENHRDFIYNVVWKMVLNPADAEDITQDIIVKIITNLASFRGESAFSTWLYRIAFNHVLNLKKRPIESTITSFDNYGRELDRVPNTDYPDNNQPTPEDLAVIEDVKFGCTAGMLLCLSREQRLIYILGEMFEIGHKLGAEILDISKDNFRQKLSRARKELYSFMDEKCGLISKSNTCRCSRKTRGFIEAGWVDAENLQFNAFHKEKIYQMADSGCDEMDDVIEEQYALIFKNQPFQKKAELKEKYIQFINSQDFKRVFNLHV